MRQYYVDGVEVSQQEYLYGKDVKVPKVPQSLINKRVELLNKNLGELLDVSWRVRDASRVNRIVKAISFWQNINKGD